MSQQGILSDNGAAGGDLDSLQADSGGVVGPNGSGVIFITGGSGATTTGNPGTNTITIDLDTGISGSGSTVGAVTANLITVDLGAMASCWTLEARVAGFESSTPAGVSSWALGSFRTDGATATEIQTESEQQLADAAVAAAQVNWVASGNNAVLQVQGVAGLTISWNAEGETVQAT